MLPGLLRSNNRTWHVYKSWAIPAQHEAPLRDKLSRMLHWPGQSFLRSALLSGASAYPILLPSLISQVSGKHHGLKIFPIHSLLLLLYAL